MRIQILAGIVAVFGWACGGTVVPDDGIGGEGGSGGTTSGPNGSGPNGSGPNGSGPNGSGPNGSTTTSGAGGATQSEFEAYCDRRALTCGEQNPDCKSQAGCALGFLRDAIESDLLACLGGVCDDGGQCLAAATQTPISDIGGKFRAACDTFSSECAGNSDDICSFGYLLSDEALLPFIECYGLPSCSGTASCLENATAVIENCDGWL